MPSPTLPNYSDLPYHLPTDALGQLRELAKIIDVPFPLALSGGSLAADAVSATILFRHFDQAQRHEALKLFAELSSRQLRGLLLTRALDTAFVNPKWGVWSLTNEELMAEESFHRALDEYASWAGVGFSMVAGKDIIKTAWKNRKLARGGIATMVVWVAVAGNKGALANINEEQRRRSQTKSSSFH